MSEVLVLLTNDYPAAVGDASFLANEIDELATQFDQVIIFSYRSRGDARVELPENVTHAGALCDAPRVGGVRGLLSARLGRASCAAAIEATGGSLWQNPRQSWGNIFTGIRFADYIARQLRRLGVTREDGIFVYSFWGTHSALALPFLRGATRITMRMHRFDLYEEENPHLPLRATLFDAVDTVVTISDDGCDYLRWRYGPKVLDPHKVLVSRLGTRDPGVSPVASRCPDEESESLRVVSCSSLAPVKNVGALIPALESLAARGPVEWTHLGGGPLEDELRMEADAAMTRQPNLHADIRGWTPHEEVMAYYRENRPHLLVNVSDSEGVPVSIMEAMSFGVPVVATDVGGTGEIVDRQRGSGVLIPLRPTTEQIVEAITVVTTQPSAFNPRRTWSELSDAETNAKQIARIVRGRLE